MAGHSDRVLFGGYESDSWFAVFSGVRFPCFWRDRAAPFPSTRKMAHVGKCFFNECRGVSGWRCDAA
jgi:hypothetical protein